MDFADTELIFTVVVAAATFMTFWALWSAFAVQPPIEGRLGALRTRRMKTRSEQAGSAKPSPAATSLGGSDLWIITRTLPAVLRGRGAK